MSRTDRHRPEGVQAADPLEQNFFWHDQGGHWGWVQVFYHRTCGCHLCGMRLWRTQENRRRRHEDQRRARDAVKGVEWL